jgi:hypothetical protein
MESAEGKLAESDAEKDFDRRLRQGL